MEEPETASWGLSISDEDFAKLKRGFWPQDMDDKWLFKEMTDQQLASEAAKKQAMKREAIRKEAKKNGEIMDEVSTDGLVTDDEDEEVDEVTPDLTQGGNISIRRSWTHKELFRLAVTPSDGTTSAKIETITWEQGYTWRISEEQAKRDTVNLCRLHLKCQLSAAPDYDYNLGQRI